MITNFEKPEILSPAGDMDCLKSALNFGADAVFLAGKMFGMRSAPQNFDNDQLKKACDLAHAKGARIHVTCNTLPRNNEIPHLQEFMENAQACGVDAFIIADLGVFEAAKKYAPKVQRHISTQAGVTNYAAANVLYNMGASRVVLAREIPLDEIAEMRAKVPKELEIECFVHGAMCVSFSGRCLISSYMTGRDANHGDCAQPCRWKYHLYEENRQGQYFPVEETGDGTYLYNSRDLCMIEHMDDVLNSGIDSLKIEGRMKSVYYIATLVKTYRMLIDEYYEKGVISEERMAYYEKEFAKAENRPSGVGFYAGMPRAAGHLYEESRNPLIQEFIAYILDYDEKTQMAYIEVRNHFAVGAGAEVFGPNCLNRPFVISDLFDENKEALSVAKTPMQRLYMKIPFSVKRHDMIRRRRSI